MTENCPRCGAMVTFFASDVGNTITCRACGEGLSVTSDGLVRNPVASAPPPVVTAAPAAAAQRPSAAAAAPSPRPASAPQAPLGGAVEWLGWLLGMLFLPGLCLTLLFEFLPAVDRAAAKSLDAELLELKLTSTKARQELDQKKEEKRQDLRKKERELQYKYDELSERRQELDRRRTKSKGDKGEMDDLQREEDVLRRDEKGLFKESEQLREEREKLESSLKKTFREDLERLDKTEKDGIKKQDKLALQQQAAAATSLRLDYWCQGGQLLGLLVLMVGSVGYLSAKQSLVRRIVGAIVLGVVVLLLVAKLNGGRGVILGLSGPLADSPPKRLAHTTAFR
jgi:hypothetical protein